jgi:hypothetical protein
VNAQRFDFVFLRFDGARFGRAALDRIDAQAAGPDAALVHQRIATVRKLDNKWNRNDLDQGQANLAANLRVHPAGALLPAELLRTDFSIQRERWGLPPCLYLGHTVCDAVLLDVNGDGKPEVIVLPDNGVMGVLGEIAPGQWRLIGTASGRLCGPVRKALLDANARGVEPALRDIEAGGKRLHLNPVEPPNGGPCAAAE